MANYNRHDGSTGPGPGFGTGNDLVRVTGGSTVNGGIATGVDNDTVLIGHATINGGILTGGNVDTVTIDSTYTIPGVSATTDGPVQIFPNGSNSAIAAGAGADTVTILNEVQITGNVVLGLGNDTVFIDISNDLYPTTDTGSILGIVDGGDGDDDIRIDGAVSIGGVQGGNGADYIQLNDPTAVFTGLIDGDESGASAPGNDTIDVVGGTFQGGLDGNGGNDMITIGDAAFQGTNQVTGGAGDDVIKLEFGTYDAGVTIGGVTETGNDTFVVTGLSGNLTIDGGEDGPDDGTPDGDTDVLDLSGLVGTVVYTADPQLGESGVFTEQGTGYTITFTNIENVIDPVCFVAGTLIDTISGPQPIEQIEAGDLVWTKDRGFQPLRWIGRRRVSATELARHPRLRPIVIPAGALGDQMPARDLRVSPQHRVFVSSKIVRRMFDTEAVLVPAKHLVGIAGIHECEDCKGVDYFHMLFDQHEIVNSEGAFTESLFLGKQAVKSLSPEAQEEIALLFPELLASEAVWTTCVRPTVAGKRVRRMGERHHLNKMPLVEQRPRM